MHASTSVSRMSLSAFLAMSPRLGAFWKLPFDLDATDRALSVPRRLQAFVQSPRIRSDDIPTISDLANSVMGNRDN